MSAEQKFDALFGGSSAPTPFTESAEIKIDSEKTVTRRSDSPVSINSFRFTDVSEKPPEPEKPKPKEKPKIAPISSDDKIKPKPKRASKKPPKVTKPKNSKKQNQTNISPLAKRMQNSMSESPFALAFGKVESDSEDENFGDDNSERKGSAEECWDQMMNEIEKPQKKGIKLGLVDVVFR